MYAKLFIGDVVDVLKTFRPDSIDLVMTSPPYWGLRDYGVKGQIGLEPTFEEYVEKMIAVCREIRRVLKPTGSFYLNLGDTYVGSNIGLNDYRLKKSKQNTSANPQFPWKLKKSLQSQVTTVRQKSLLGMPWRVVLRLLDDGWILRNDIIWHKTNALPASVKDRLSNRYEHLFHFVKSEHYYYDLDAIRVPHTSTKDIARLQKAGGVGKARLEFSGKWSGKHSGHAFLAMHARGKNPGDVWAIPTGCYKGAHFAVYPEKLCIQPILSSCPPEVCSKCGAPKRQIIGRSCDKGTAFNIRIRDAKKGILQNKWGHRFSATNDEIKGYHESSYRTRSGKYFVSKGCKCHAGFQPGIVLDPFAGSGTTMKVALEIGRNAIGIELNKRYAEMNRSRVHNVSVITCLKQVNVSD